MTNKIENTDIFEIRMLLAEWYDASISPEQERHLHRLLAATPSLPEDIAGDAELFMAISIPEDTMLPEIPEKLNERIKSALEQEFAKTRRGINIFGHHISRYAVGWIAAVIALAAPAAWLTIDRILKTEKADDVAGKKLALNVAPLTDSVNNRQTLTLAKDENPIPETSAKEHKFSSACNSRNHIPGHSIDGPEDSPAKSRTSQRPETVEDDNFNELDFYPYSDEERELLADNYRIVSDRREAEAIVSTVIMRLQGNLMSESQRISEINSQYQLETNKLYKLDNVKYSKDHHDEKIKI